MRIVVQEDISIVTSAYISKVSGCIKLIVNTTERWCDAYSGCLLTGFDEQTIALEVYSYPSKQATILIVPECKEEQSCFENATRYQNIEKDQIMFIWIQNKIEESEFLASYRKEDQV